MVLVGVLIGLLSAGLIWLASRPPQGEQIYLSAPPSPAPWVIHVEGAVVRPGVYELPAGSRIRDAIGLAGGLLPEADEGAVNLASVLQDGGRVFVPGKLEQGSASAGQAPPGGPSGGQAGPPGTLIDINTADATQLEELPGIGPVTAQKIVDFRNAEGAFSIIEDIQKVPGIGPVTFERIRSLITVGD